MGLAGDNCWLSLRPALVAGLRIEGLLTLCTWTEGPPALHTKKPRWPSRPNSSLAALLSPQAWVLGVVLLLSEGKGYILP